MDESASRLVYGLVSTKARKKYIKELSKLVWVINEDNLIHAEDNNMNGMLFNYDPKHWYGLMAWDGEDGKQMPLSH